MAPSDTGTISDITIQNSIIAETLYDHSTGMLITSYVDETGRPDNSRVSILRNLFAHNGHRNPRVSYVPEVQVINNVVYNWDGRVGTTKGSASPDFIANYWKPGPTSNIEKSYLHEHADPSDPTIVFPPPSIFIEGNLIPPKSPSSAADNWSLFTFNYHLRGQQLPTEWRRFTPHNSPIPVTILSAEEAYETVLADVGANARLDEYGNWVRRIDSIDQAILDDVANGTGPATESANDHQNDYGGYPQINPGKPYADSDHDGMPDTWERMYGFNPNNDTDSQVDADGDGYTNLEEFLNSSTPGNSVATEEDRDSVDRMSIEVRVAASSDDAEEKASGDMSLTSSDLELVSDSSDQLIGMRFVGVNIPQGATITKAYLQFQVDETTTEVTKLKIQGEDSDNAATFTSSDNNISSRPTTTANVFWEPEPWTTKGEAGLEQQTPDLTSVIQEIVNRPGWGSGNSLATIITGSGERVAEAFDGDQDNAPLLYVEFTAS